MNMTGDYRPHVGPSWILDTEGGWTRCDHIIRVSPAGGKIEIETTKSTRVVAEVPAEDAGEAALYVIRAIECYGRILSFARCKTVEDIGRHINGGLPGVPTPRPKPRDLEL